MRKYVMLDEKDILKAITAYAKGHMGVEMWTLGGASPDKEPVVTLEKRIIPGDRPGESERVKIVAYVDMQQKFGGE